MKAQPVRIVDGRYEPCAVDEATHLTIYRPGPAGRITLPVMLHGRRAGTGNWSWNGNTEWPTLRPSLKTTGRGYVCHTWVTEGRVRYLEDCTHELRNTTVPLIDVEDVCRRCDGSGEDPEFDGPCRDCGGTGTK